MTISLSPKVYEELEALARENGHRVSGYVRWLIWKHLEEMETTVSVLGKKPPLAKEVARAEPVTEDCILAKPKYTK